MDDQIDGRTLVGTYVCTDRPGEFRWQPGSLTQAVQNGLWIVFEDINKAPSDLHSILVPLLEGAGSFATGHGEVVRVAESFRIFSTIAVSKLDTSESAGQNSLSVFWRRVMVPPLDNQDLQDILKVRYPDLELHVSQLIETFERVNNISMLQFAGFHPGSSTSVFRACRFSLRDLLKWCKRIAGLGFSPDGSLSENQCFCVYKEAVDIFQYIEEVWNGTNPLLPSDPYQRAQTIFWADYVDVKIFNNLEKISKSKGEEREVAKKELIEGLKLLEEELGDKTYFGGENLGFVDIALVPLYPWWKSFETYVTLNIDDECPKLTDWAKRCIQKESVAKNLPGPQKVTELTRKIFGIE